mmetsp:Transcript_5124/g.19187  ORF Transcript_5124/g.19187 Transcript_5124/m.19187 type:complete len:1344 (-) Transcript_5124:126-4157(-)
MPPIMDHPRLVPANATAKDWRIMSMSSDLATPWEIKQVRFFADDVCAQDITMLGNASGSASGASNAFDANATTAWIAECGEFCCGAWLGVTFDIPRQVRCVLVDLPVTGQGPPLALQMSVADGEWRHVASLSPDGGVADTWDPVAQGAACQGIAVLTPDVRAGGSLYVLSPYGLTKQPWQVRELSMYADAACSVDITRLGIASESLVWRGAVQPGHTPTKASDAFDGNVSSVWQANFGGEFWVGDSALKAPLLGLHLPAGIEVNCIRVNSDVAQPLRMMKCSGPSAWVGLDNCVCQSSWADTSSGTLPFQATVNSYLPVLGVGLLACLFVAAAWKIERLERSVRAAASWTFLREGQSRQASLGKGRGDRRPLVEQEEEEENSEALDDGAMSGMILGETLGDVPPVHQQFRKQVQANPHACCLRSIRGDSTFAEVAARVDALVAQLRAGGLQKQSVVGLMLARGPCMIVAVLAVLEAESAWVPLDDRAPPDRLRSMLEDAGASLLLVDEGANWDLGVPTMQLSLEGAALAAVRPQLAGSMAAAPADTACLYYTSGSTGLPKAVVMDHRFFVVNAKWFVDEFGMTSRSVSAAKARFIWATALWEILPPLISGATLLLLPTLKTEEVARKLAEGGATHLTGVPSELELIMDADLKLQHVICMGERLLPAIAERLMARIPRGCVLWNAYAATESPVTLWQVPRGAHRILAGRPLQGSFVAVLAEDGSLAPAGEIGEVVMGGVIPRCGYWRRPDLTAERFGESSVGFIYRTGDLGRIVRGANAEPTMEITGRKDRQVKIRGQRVELGEVEAVAVSLAAETGAAAAVVTAGGDDGQQHLFLFGAPVPALDAATLRGAMAQKLPQYMLPDMQRIKLIDALPRLPNGKVNFMELKASAAALLDGEEHEALDSLGLARRYSQEQLAAKNAIETASGSFLLGMLFYHGAWWPYGAQPLGLCLDCTPSWVIRILQAVVVNETCLYGFVVGSALMVSSQADCFAFSVRDGATLIVYLFQYCPWGFFLVWFSHSEVGSDLIPGDTGGVAQYSRWYLLMILVTKVLLVLTKRSNFPPSIVLALLVVGLVSFPESGRISATSDCVEPTGLIQFLFCWVLPEGIMVERKWVSPMLLYYATIMYGQAMAGLAGNCLPRPQATSWRAVYGVACYTLSALLGFWYIGFVYPTDGTETVEWPDGAVAFVSNPRIDNKLAVIMLTMAITVPVVQVALVFAAVYYGPGDRAKQVAASWVSATMLGTYLISENLNFGNWVLQVIFMVCNCQCSDMHGLAQLAAAGMLLIAVSLSFGLLYQMLLLRVVVPSVLRGISGLSERIKAALHSSDGRLSDSSESDIESSQE